MDFVGKEDKNETLLSCISSYCVSDELADIHFCFPEQTGRLQRISAHKMILAFRSSVFKAMFYGTFPQTEGDIEITDIEAETFLAFKRFIYTDKVDLNENIIIPLLHAAQKYQVSSLLFKCASFLSGILNVNNACTIFTQAKFFSLLKLEKEALQFIAKHAAKCFGTDDYLNLSSQNLKVLLGLDFLSLTEIQIFQFVLKWADDKLLKANRNIMGYSRRSELIQDGILYTIAMPLLALEDFTKTVVPNGILIDEEQLYIFKAITMKDISNSQRFPFRMRPRRGSKMLTLNLDSVVFQYEGQINAAFAKEHSFKQTGYNNQMMETLTLKTDKALKIVSISLKPSIAIYGNLTEAKVPNHLAFIVSIESETYKGTYENNTWSVEPCYYIPINEIINIQVSLEDKRKENIPNSRPRNARQNQSHAMNRKRHLNFTWIEKGHPMLEFDTTGTRLVENIHIVEVNRTQ